MPEIKLYRLRKCVAALQYNGSNLSEIKAFMFPRILKKRGVKFMLDDYTELKLFDYIVRDTNNNLMVETAASIATYYEEHNY